MIRWFCCTTNRTAAIVVAVFEILLAILSVVVGIVNYRTLFAAIHEPDPHFNVTIGNNSEANAFLSTLATISITSSLSVTGVNLLATVLLFIGILKKNTCLTLLWIILNALYMTLIALGVGACIVGLTYNLDQYINKVTESAEFNDHENELLKNVIETIKIANRVLLIVLAVLLMMRLWFMAIVLAARVEIQNERQRQLARTMLATYSSSAGSRQQQQNNSSSPNYITTVSYPTHATAYGHVNENFYNSEDFSSKLM